MKSKIGVYEIDDNTPHCRYRNNVFVQMPSRAQVLDVEKYSTNVIETKIEGEDDILTTALRANAKRYGNIHDISKLFKKPMYSFTDGVSMMLPMDNKLGVDYLTYRDERYFDFILELCEELVKFDPATESSCRVLLIDYSAHAPYASPMRRDGRMTFKRGLVRDDLIGPIFGNRLMRFLSKNLDEALGQQDRFMPPRNAKKGIGFYSRFPDGSRAKKEDFLFIPKKLDVKGVSKYENLWSRVNWWPLKKAWLESGSLKRNFDYLLDNCDRFSDPQVFLHAFLHGGASVHTEGYRINNGDPALNDFSSGVRAAVREGLYKKNRDFAYECAPGVFRSGLYDDKRLGSRMREVLPKFKLLGNKKRPMFPGPNTTHSTPYIVLCRFLLGPAEHRSTGFPSERQSVQDRYTRFHSLDGNSCIVTFDRRTAEQCITDNIELILSFFSGRLRHVLSAVLTSVVPSEMGPRVVKGLLSGTSLTTFLNVVFGLYENIIITSCIAYGPEWLKHLGEVCDAIFDELENERDYVEINGLKFCHNLGTDDQIFYVKGSGDIKHRCENNLKASGYSPDERSLTIEITEDATVFGLHFTTSDVSVSQILGLNKIWLCENERLGDNIAVKYLARFALLDKYYDVIQKVMTKHQLGSISSFKLGHDNFFSNLGEFGFSYYANGLNQYSPSDRIALGKYHEKMGLDISTYQDVYEPSELEEFTREFKLLLKS